MPRIITVPLSADLTETALEQISDPCQLIFPTEVSAARARQRFMADWQLQDCEFISIKQLKNDLLLPGIPSVSDDKRLLCLYQSLTDEDRQHFHINGYFDSVDWGNHFFQFFEELCDECVEVGKLSAPFESFGINLLGWQEEYLLKVLSIHSRYRDRLDQLGLTDPIFSTRASEVKVPCRGCRFVFVNQYYFSKLEKQLIKALEASGNEVFIISQSCGPKMDPEQLTTPETRLEELKPSDIRTQKIEVVECENEEQMVLAFLANHDPEVEDVAESRVIIDSMFNRKHYRHLFSPAKYKASQAGSFIRSGIYAFLQTLHAHLHALNSTLDQSFVPLRLLLAACAQDNFIRYYHPDWGSEERDLLLNELRFLFDQDILYVDKDLEIFKVLNDKRAYSYLPRLLTPHFALLAKLAQIQSPSGLVYLIDLPEGLSIQRMCRSQELLYSNALEEFYERLANFASLGTQGVVDSWSDLFAPEGAGLAENILQLLLEALASARLSFAKTAREETRVYDVSNLLDLRNLSYDTVVFFHAIEGVYPSNPEPVWLFNENQRQRLGLKSFDALRRRERYYFLRQVLNSRQALIYCYRDQEHDIEPGSFVTELIHASENKELAGIIRIVPELFKPRISDLYQSRAARYGKHNEYDFQTKAAFMFGLNRADPNDFFVMPVSPQADFDEHHSLKVSYQSLSLLDKNPFAWYVRELRKLRCIELRPQETITRKLFGALLHGFLAKVLGRLKGPHQAVEELAVVLDSETELSKEISQLISSTLYLYKLPQNYNHEFLVSVISQCLVRSVRQFYREFLVPRLRGTSFELQPEEGRMTDFESQHKLLVSHILDEIEYHLKIRGIADLRVKCPAKNLIVDFKTGSHEVGQLLFYEWFYYLLNEDYAGRELDSTFWMILEQKNLERTDQAKRDKWRERMRQNLEDCLIRGYGQGKNSTHRKTMRNITRADLYHPPAGGGE
ncbi:MAG: PD-(D/E)XK nuclease family protein [Candidatus Syntrophosphaera sp.]|nr:PD-(D/E)XK nuclease family protein [Candidatus Syntrophosphaera sp.]